MKRTKMDTELERYYVAVFRFLRGLSLDEQLAEDLTQETFSIALKEFDSFRGESEFYVWLCAIGKNLLYSYYRKCKREVPLDVIENYEADEKLFTDMIADREAALDIHRILHGMKEPYKEIFSLRVFGELSYKNIGDLFGKSEHWACVSYHRAKKIIQDEMKEKRRDLHENGL